MATKTHQNNNMKHCSTKTLSILIACYIVLPGCCVSAARFAANGPVLTVTLKDPDDTSSSEPKKWGLNLSAMRPAALWSIKSLDAPLPKWIPSLKYCRGTVGYRYEDLKRAPTIVEGEVSFSNDAVGELHVQPSLDFKRRRMSMLIHAVRGEAYGLIKIATRGKSFVELVRASYRAKLPFSSMSAVRITPTFDFVQSKPSCTVESLTGSGRTKAVLSLSLDDPTLAVVHNLDRRNTIAPEISLQSAKIVYLWNVVLDSGSIRTRVDPTSDIHVTWTDRSANGKWVTDFRLPLSGTTVGALASQVRVRRQFSF